jgi:hypothetical protein
MSVSGDFMIKKSAIVAGFFSFCSISAMQDHDEYVKKTIATFEAHLFNVREPSLVLPDLLEYYNKKRVLPTEQERLLDTTIWCKAHTVVRFMDQDIAKDAFPGKDNEKMKKYSDALTNLELVKTYLDKK